MTVTRYAPFLAALVLMPALASRYAAAPADVPSTSPSRITAATVYLDRAVVTRTVSVDLLSGESTVSFENLPAALTDQSLNASARGVAGASILDVGASTVFTETAPNEKVKAVEDEIKGLQRQIRTLDDRGKILEQQRLSVERMLAASTAVIPGGERGGAPRLPFEEWLKLMTYSDETLGKFAKEQQALDIQREDLQAKKAAHDRDLNQLRGARGRQSKTVRVRLALVTPGRIEVAIQYAVPNAGWTPSYDARLASSERAVELSYFGVVQNGTGEDWKDINLTLSTARPGLGGAAPELRPWITQINRAASVGNDPITLITTLPGYRANPLGHEYDTVGGVPMTMPNTTRDGMSVTDGFSPGGVGGGRGAKAAPAPPPPPAKAAVLAADVESGVSSATFKIPVTVSVAGNNVTQRVNINTTKLPAMLQYQATPKLLEAAFLSASVTNSSDYPLLAGPMNTFLDGTFVATGSLKTVMPAEKFELALGAADDGIKVKRRVVNRFQEDTGLANKNRRVTYEVQISFTNNKTTVEKLTFKEPTPVSRDEKVTVKLLIPTEKEIGTPANPKEVTREEDGRLVWRVSLDPGKKRDFTLKLSIEYPNDVTVTGIE